MSRFYAPGNDAAGDLESFPWQPYRGKVAGLIGGIPCPDFSVAGKQAGVDGERWLWPAFWDLATKLRVDWIALENVSGFIPGRGLATVDDDLAKARWTAEWLHLRAAEVGTSHERDRIFILANAPGQRIAGRGVPEPKGREYIADAHRRGAELGNTEGHDKCGNSESAMHRQGKQVGGSSRALGNPDSSNDDRSWDGRTGGRRESTDSGEQLAYADGSGRSGRSGRSGERGDEREEQSTTERNRLPLFAPGPNDERWPAILREFPHLAPALGKEEAEQLFRGMVDEYAASILVSGRADQLRAGGNSCCISQSAFAYAELFRRLES